MTLSRTLLWLLSIPLSFIFLAAVTGCGAASKKAASQPENTTTRTQEGGEVSRLDSMPLAEREAGQFPINAADSSASGPRLDSAAAASVADIRATTTADTAPPRFATSPVSSGTSIPKMVTPEPEIVFTPPRLAAPMLPVRTPETAVHVQPERTVSAARTALAPTPPVESAVPSLAPISLEPIPAEAPAESVVTEEAAALDATPPDSADGSPPVSRTPIAEDRGEFQAVTVFYGTDRNSIAVSGQPAQPHRLWLYSAGVCTLLLGLFSLMAMAASRKKAFACLAIMSFAAACVMATMGTIAWLQSDRAIAGPKLKYGNGRGTFVLGTCEVSIPRSHQVAQLEAPSVFKLDFVEDPTKHIALLEVAEKDSETFFSQLRSRVDQSHAKDAFVFVHGFNVTFEEAARRTAQLAYDLKFQGAPVFYSWPSQGGLFQYAVDETNVVWTVPHLQQFLTGIAGQSGARSVHLIAHSMGNRALTSALRELSRELRGASPLFHEVVLTAPDIDAEIFRRDIAPAIVTTAKRVTLYASSNDEALLLSKQVHGYPRAGETGDGLVVIPGIETIDVSAVDTSLVGHTYYGDNATVISDMIDLVRNSKSAQQRSWLVTARFHDLLYWVFRMDRGTVGATQASEPSRY